MTEKNSLSSVLKLVNNENFSLEKSTLYVRHVDNYSGIWLSQEKKKGWLPLVQYLSKKSTPELSAVVRLQYFNKHLKETDKIVLRCLTSLVKINFVSLYRIYLYEKALDHFMSIIFAEENKIKSAHFLDPRNNMQSKIFLGYISKMTSLKKFSIPNAKYNFFIKEYENIYSTTKISEMITKASVNAHIFSKLSLGYSLWTNITTLKLENTNHNPRILIAMLLNLSQSRLADSIETFTLHTSIRVSWNTLVLKQVELLEVPIICSNFKAATYFLYPVFLEVEGKIRYSHISFRNLSGQRSYYLTRNKRLSRLQSTRWMNHYSAGYEIRLARER
eukprot:snap_masked-scaffold_13-processed-gene-6.48-mRNA-1 protein AED:1.00 eAED:1.00 QI:0/0/0/0/1/1/2/0/331